MFRLPQKTWTSFKQVVQQRNLYIYQVHEDPSCYLLVACDGVILIQCYLCKSLTADVSDYETNFQPYLNKCCSNGEYIEDDD